MGSLTLGGADAGNYTLVGATGTVTITQLPVTLTGTRLYDGTTNAAFSILTISNAIAPDVVTVASGAATLASKNAGPQAITSIGTLALGGADAANYTLVGATGTVTITQLPVTLTGTRLYDGTTDADFSILTISNAIAPDVVTVASGAATLASKNAGPQAITFDRHAGARRRRRGELHAGRGHRDRDDHPTASDADRHAALRRDHRCRL